MWISDLSIRRPVFATMLIGALVVLGSISLARLGVNFFPELDMPYVSVTTALEGASPETIETEVTDVSIRRNAAQFEITTEVSPTTRR